MFREFLASLHGEIIEVFDYPNLAGGSHISHCAALIRGERYPAIRFRCWINEGESAAGQILVTVAS